MDFMRKLKEDPKKTYEEFFKEQDNRELFDKNLEDNIRKAFKDDAEFTKAIEGGTYALSSGTDFSDIMGGADILAVGEGHGPYEFSVEVNMMMKQLAQREANPLTHFASEFFKHTLQDTIDAYEKGEISIDEVDCGHFGDEPCERESNLMIANRYKVKTIALDVPTREEYLQTGWATTEEGFEHRNTVWADKIKDIFNSNKNARVLLYCGSRHSEYDTGAEPSTTKLLSERGLKVKVLRFIYREHAWPDYIKSRGLGNNKVIIVIPEKYRNLANADILYYLPDLTESKNQFQKKVKERNAGQEKIMQIKSINYCDVDDPACQIFLNSKKDSAPLTPQNIQFDK